MLNLFLNFKFNFFKKKDEGKPLDKLYKASKNFNLSVLPIAQDYDIDNLYPITNHVHIWSTFVIGNDKSYILCNIGDEYISFKDKDNIVNTKGTHLPKDLFEFLNNVWDITLEGKNLQFFIVLDNHLYLFNSYSLKNEKNKVVAASGFMRKFESIKINKNIISEGLAF